jgi:hypothetical protein
LFANGIFLPRNACGKCGGKKGAFHFKTIANTYFLRAGKTTTKEQRQQKKINTTPANVINHIKCSF